MSNFKSLYDKSSTIINNITYICSNFDHIIKSIHDQLFFDDKLDYGQKLYLLTHPTSVEGRFLDILIGHVSNLALDDDMRQFYFNNINQFGSGFFQIYHHTNVNNGPLIMYDDYDDTESDIEESEDDPYESDDCDDLENLLFDYYEMVYYFNNNNNANNNNNNSACSSTSPSSFQHQFQFGFDDDDNDDEY